MADKQEIRPDELRDATPWIERISKRTEMRTPAEQTISRDKLLRHLDDMGVSRPMPDSYDEWAQNPTPAPNKTYVETALDYLSDVEPSDEVKEATARRGLEETMRGLLYGEDSTDEERKLARSYLQASEESFVKSFLKGVKRAGAALAGNVKDGISDIRESAKGDIEVSGYTRTQNGKQVRVDGYRRKR